MSAIFFRFIEIALFRKGPQDLPASGFLLGLALALHAVVLAISIYIFPAGDVPVAAARTLASVVSEFVLVWVVLLAFNKGQRFLQTMTAVVGVDIVLGLAFIPLLASLPPTPDHGQLSAFQSLVYLGLMAWGVTALAWILRHAINVSSLTGAAIALSYFIFVNWLLAMVF